MDQDGCAVQRMIEINDQNIDDCFTGIPVMTPNEDGKNDALVISCLNSFSSDIRIFNRWGSKRV